MLTVRRLALILFVFILPVTVIYESPAEAGLLKNSKRVGDRSSMTIIRRPSSGARKRIFAPGERPARAAPGSTSRRQRHDWFWKIHSTGIASADPARWQAALTTLDERRAGGKAIVGIDHLRQITLAYGPQISAAAKRHNVSEMILIAVISVESRGRAKAVSPKGARGLMQLMPATAKRFGVSDSLDPAQNIGGGASYLNWLLTEFGGDPLLALAGYNAGEGAVRKHKGVPPYAETRDYVVKVFDALSALQAVCPAMKAGPRTRCNLGAGPAT
ncbi:MAG: lytic transglycosylase domain-containing protein [Pseudomonadota bacterium]